MKVPFFFLVLQTAELSGLIWKVPAMISFQGPLVISFWVLTLFVFVLHAILSEKDVTEIVKQPGFVSTQSLALNANLVREDHLELPANGVPDKNLPEFGVEAANAAALDSAPKKLCRMCNKYQLVRTKHCHECEKCVLTFDHHCVFFHNCVGEKNRPFFYFYLLVLSGQALLATLLIQNEFRMDMLDYALFGLFAVFIAQFTMLATLFVFHNYLMLRGMTTWEYFSEDCLQEGGKHSYSRGCLHNLKMYWKSGFLEEAAVWTAST